MEEEGSCRVNGIGSGNECTEIGIETKKNQADLFATQNVKDTSAQTSSTVTHIKAQRWVYRCYLFFIWFTVMVARCKIKVVSRQAET